MLQNKKILIAGLANKHSIAAGIARAMHAQGAELAFTYQSERLKGNVINTETNFLSAMSLRRTSKDLNFLPSSSSSSSLRQNLNKSINSFQIQIS